MKTKKMIAGLAAVSLLLAECGGTASTVMAAGAPTAAKSLTITAGKKKTIKVSGANIKSKAFKSSKTKIASVNKKGVVTAKRAGNCRIAVTVKYRKTKKAKKLLTKKLICKIKVTGGQTVPVTEPTADSTVTPAPVVKNEDDVNALKAIIEEQKALGAAVSEDLDSEEYIWSKNGELTGVNWENKQLQGSLTFSAFEKLESLNCAGSKVTALDVSNNTALIFLNCTGNRVIDSKTGVITYEGILAALDINNDTALKTLWCEGNQLMNLDVSSNTALVELNCDANQLTGLDVSNNTALTELWCQKNQLMGLDVSNNTALTELYCDENQLTGLDVSKNTALTNLWCQRNQLTSLDVSNNIALTELYCDENPLMSLDVSNNTSLADLCYDKNIITLIGWPKISTK